MVKDTRIASNGKSVENVQALSAYLNWITCNKQGFFFFLLFFCCKRPERREYPLRSIWKQDMVFLLEVAPVKWSVVSDNFDSSFKLHGKNLEWLRSRFIKVTIALHLYLPLTR